MRFVLHLRYEGAAKAYRAHARTTGSLVRDVRRAYSKRSEGGTWILAGCDASHVAYVRPDGTVILRDTP